MQLIGHEPMTSTLQKVALNHTKLGFTLFLLRPSAFIYIDV